MHRVRWAPVLLGLVLAASSRCAPVSAQQPEVFHPAVPSGGTDPEIPSGEAYHTRLVSLNGDGPTASDRCGCDRCGCDSCAQNGSCGSCANPGCSACQTKKNPCLTSHKGVFYDNDFSYLNDPDYHGWCLGDCMKQLGVGGCGTLDVGGQVRLRYHHEVGMKGVRFSDNVDDFLLTRVRLYGDYHANSWLRVYAEGIYADSSWQSFPPRPIDDNYGDLLNGFLDVRLTDNLTFRAGRQELLYGAQRTVSPLDWSNTRRTFQGVKLMYDRNDLKVDGFFTHLVPPDPTEFDEPDYDQRFYGAYAVYDGMRDAALDLYYLGYDDRSVPFSLHTFGYRLYGNVGPWLSELECAYQTGENLGVDQEDGFLTAGMGRQVSSCGWQPTVWFYFDYASDNYNQLFPLAHKYLGFIDAVQRTNVISPNVLLTANPTEKLSLLLWYYNFQSATDGPIPSIGGTPPQNAGRNFGNELDLLVSYRWRPRCELLVGYSHFWRGSKIDNTTDADFVYVQWTTDF